MRVDCSRRPLTATELKRLSEAALLNRSAFDDLIRRADDFASERHYEQAVGLLSRASQMAAHTAPHGAFVSESLEAVLVRIGRDALPPSPARISNLGKRRVLHVTTAAYSMWGHTAMIRRWIQWDSESCCSVVLTEQPDRVPENLCAVVEGSGGRIHRLDPSGGVIERARQLRQIAFAESDVVVLQMFPSDVTALLAFATAEGPPVVIYDTIDHLFWPGISVADTILQMRASGRCITETERDASRCLLLPCPVPSEPFQPGEREQARRELGIDNGTRLILTAGAGYKFAGKGQAEFLDAALRICAQKDVRVVAVGPERDARWLRAQTQSEGRVRTVGPQTSMRPFQAAADLYAEGFPCGSLNALLESAALGIPCVVAPASTPPPFCSDSPGLACLRQPLSIDEYVSRIVDLIGNEQESKALGTQLRHDVAAFHGQTAWTQSLNAIYSMLPKEHRVFRIEKRGSKVSSDVRHFWMKFRNGNAEAAFRRNAWVDELGNWQASLSEPKLRFGMYYRHVLAEIKRTPLERSRCRAARRLIGETYLQQLRLRGSRCELALGAVDILCTRPDLVLSRDFLAVAIKALLGRRKPARAAPCSWATESR